MKKKSLPQLNTLSTQAKKTEINACDTIYKNGKNAYVYITYSLILEDGQSYPCISTYMTQKNEKGKYSILTPSDITDDMKKEAAARYASFMETDHIRNM